MGFSIFGRELVKSKDIALLTKSLNIFNNYPSTRPTLDPYQRIGSYGTQAFRYPGELVSLYDMANQSDTLRICILALKKEVFRQGLFCEEKYVAKCNRPECEKEYENLGRDGNCEDCFQPLTVPDLAQKQRFMKWTESVNENEQSLIEVLQAIEDDLNIIDCSYVHLVKDYAYDSNYAIIPALTEVKEVLRGSPMLFSLIIDKTGRPGRNDNGEKVYTCPQHRDTLYVTESQCPQCGYVLYPAYYRSTRGEGKLIYYIKGEILQIKKYSTNLLYGYSPILSVWQKVVALMSQDRFIKDYYGGDRPPRGMLIINTKNLESLKASWGAWLDQASKNPHMIHPFAVENEDGKDSATFIDFMKNLNEMQFTEGRNEMRRTIGAIFGVQPLFQGDVQKSGGLNNEGLQITVTNRAVESSQEIHNGQILPFIAKAMGLTDYVPKLNPVEPKDEASELSLEAMKITNAEAMLRMGFSVTMNEDKEFEFSGEARQAPSFNPSGSFPLGDASPSFDIPAGGSPAMPTKSKTLKKGFNSPAEEELYNSVGWLFKDKVQNRFKAVLPYLKQGDKILDLASGVGLFYDFLKENHIYTEYYGADINRNYNNVFKSRHPGVQLSETDITKTSLNEEYTVTSALGLASVLKGGMDTLDKMVANSLPHTTDVFVMDFWNKETYQQITPENPIEVWDRNEVGAYFSKFNHPVQIVDITPDNFLVIVNKGRTFNISDKKRMQAKMNEDLKKILNTLTLKRRPSQARMKSIIKELMDKLEGNLKKTTEKELERIYRKTIKEVEDQVRLDIGFDASDVNKLEGVKTDEIFLEAYEGINKDLTGEINEIILNAYKDPKHVSLDEMVERMKHATSEKEGRLAVIARTETQHISNLAREASYKKADPEENFVYRWDGPPFQKGRSTETCDMIKKTVAKEAGRKGGVSLKRLKEIINHAALEYDPKMKGREFTPHPNCRHAVVRTFGE